MCAHRVSSQRPTATANKPAPTAKTAADKLMEDNLNQFSQWAGDKTKAETAPPINNGQANLGHPAGAAAPGNGHFTVSPDNPFFKDTEAIPQPGAQHTATPAHQPTAYGNPLWGPNLAGFTADGQPVPQIFGQTGQAPAPNGPNPFLNNPTPHPSNPFLNSDGSAVAQSAPVVSNGSDPFQDPFLNGQYEAVLAQQTNPFIKGAGSSPAQAVPATPNNGNPYLNGHYEQLFANNPFINDAGFPPAPAIPPQPLPSPVTVDPTNPFFVGAGTEAGLPPAPTATDTAKAGIEHQVQFGVFCMAMYELILRECVKQGLQPSAVQPLLDLFLNDGIAAFNQSQSLAASAGLSGSAQPVDAQAFKAAALARQADSAKQAELTRLQQTKKNQLPPDDQPTFDPLTKRKSGGHKPITRQQSLVKLDSTSTSTSTSSSSSSDSDSTGTPLPRPRGPVRSRAPSQVRIPNFVPRGKADDAGESSTDDDNGIDMSQTQSDDTPPVKPRPVAKPQPQPIVQPVAKQPSPPVMKPVAQPQPVVKPSPVATPTPLKPQPKPQNPKPDNRVPRQQDSFQDDLAQVNRKKNEQLKSDLANEQTLAIADLKRQLDPADQQTREALLKLSKHRQSERHKQATQAWSVLHAKETAGTATNGDLANMAELDIRSTAALDHESAIKTLAATYGIAL